MKILKHGSYHRKAVVTCEECGCEFEVLPSECTKFLEIECPECGESIILHEEYFLHELSEKEK